MHGKLLGLLAAGLLLPASSLQADPLPVRILTCGASTIAKITVRLQDGSGKPVEGSGSQVFFANHGSQVSFDTIPAIQEKSRIGDHVFLCLVFHPKNCPKGDHRGKIYTTTNLRTLESWTLPDSEHSCGGA